MDTCIRLQRIAMGLVLLTVVTGAVFTVPAQAQTAPPANEWKFSITPYLWLPNINGTLKYNIPPGSSVDSSPEVEVGPNQWLQSLTGIILISGEVRKDKLSVFADVIYLGFAKEDSTVKKIDFGGSLVSSTANLSTQSTLRGMTSTLGAGYAVRDDNTLKHDVFCGVRYFQLAASTDWQLSLDVAGPGGTQTFPRSGGISGDLTLWDGVVGFKGRVPLGGSRWTVPYYVDGGGSSSSLTYQWMLGIDYSFTWGDVSLAYRDLYFNQKGDNFIRDLRFSGPVVGATFRF